MLRIVARNEEASGSHDARHAPASDKVFLVATKMRINQWRTDESRF